MHIFLVETERRFVKLLLLSENKKRTTINKSLSVAGEAHKNARTSGLTARPQKEGTGFFASSRISF